MEKENGNKDAIKEHIGKIVRPIFEKAASEISNTQVLVGLSQSKEPEKEVFCYWQPHNFRRYFGFSKENFSPEKPKPTTPIETNVGSKGNFFISLPFNWDYTYKTGNYGHEHIYLDFLQCNVRVRKSQIEITNKVAPDKRWVKIYAESLKDVDKRIEQITQELENHCIEALRLFIKIHGGKSDFEVLNRHSEDKIKGEDFTESLDPNMVIHDTVMKKPYKEKLIEIYGGKAQVKNYVKNRLNQAVLLKFVLNADLLRKRFWG